MVAPDEARASGGERRGGHVIGDEPRPVAQLWALATTLPGHASPTTLPGRTSGHPRTLPGHCLPCQLDQLGAVPHHTAPRASSRNARKAARSSASEAKLAWWSSSTLVSTAISTASESIERSDSSASTTSHSPAPHCALGRPPPTGAPTSQPGSAGGGAQDVHEHRRGGRLAVRARHRDRAPQRAQLAQQLCAGPLAQPPLARRRPLGVLGGHGAGVDDLHVLAGGQVGGVVADARLQHPIRAQALQVGGVGAVRSADLRPQGVRGARIAAHPRAADADEVQAPPAPRPARGAHRRPTPCAHAPLASHPTPGGVSPRAAHNGTAHDRHAHAPAASSSSAATASAASGRASRRAAAAIARIR